MKLHGLLRLLAILLGIALARALAFQRTLAAGLRRLFGNAIVKRGPFAGPARPLRSLVTNGLVSHAWAVPSSHLLRLGHVGFTFATYPDVAAGLVPLSQNQIPGPTVCQSPPTFHHRTVPPRPRTDCWTQCCRLPGSLRWPARVSPAGRCLPPTKPTRGGWQSASVVPA